jgi:PAS domain S-box-containing protein
MKEKANGEEEQFNSPPTINGTAALLDSRAEIEPFWLAAIVESSADAIYSTDFNGAILSWNKAAEKIFGYAAQEAIGQNVSILLHPDLLSLETKIPEKVKKGKTIKNYETVRVRNDGSRIRISLTASPIRNRQGKIIAVAEIARDITERFYAEERLTENQKLLNNHLSEIETLYQTAPIGLAFLDKNLRYVRINDRLAKLNGIPAENHIGRTLREVLPVELADNVEPIFLNVLATNTPILNLEVTGEVSTQPGIKRTFISNYYPLTNSDAETIGVCAVVQEITGISQTEEKNRRNAQHLHGLIDTLFSFVGLLDVDGTLKEVNRAALAAANLQSKDVIGKKFAETFWWSWAEPVKEQLNAAIVRAGRGETVRYNAIIKVGKNQFLTIDFQLAPMFDENKNVIQIVSSAIDISERLKLEAKLNHVARMSLVGELVAGLAHEIKNPLTGIQGAIDLLTRRQPQKSSEHKILEDVSREIARINDTVHLLLNRAQPRSINIVQASLRETVRRAVQLAKHHLAARELKKQIKIKSNLPVESFVLRHDPAQIEDAVLNLIFNAIDAIGNNSGRINVGLFKSQTESDEPEAVIEITDTGCGISKEDLSKLFKPFYTTKESGTGLGLPAVKRIAAAHGGYCVVESFGGQGSTFTIHLPINFKSQD